MQTLVDKINEQIEIFQTNANLQLTKNNKAAGTRARKAALEISKNFQHLTTSCSF